MGDEGGVDKLSDVAKISESDKVVSEGDVGEGEGRGETKREINGVAVGKGGKKGVNPSGAMSGISWVFSVGPKVREANPQPMITAVRPAKMVVTATFDRFAPFLWVGGN
jgi:hypothetical protein